MNTAKRTMALVLVVCMVFALTVSVSADDHTHSYTETVLKAPTCTANGIAKYACECGQKYYKSIPAAHAEPGADAVTVEPTCAKDGNGFTTLVIGPETKARTDRLRSYGLVGRSVTEGESDTRYPVLYHVADADKALAILEGNAG